MYACCNARTIWKFRSPQTDWHSCVAHAVDDNESSVHVRIMNVHDLKMGRLTIDDRLRMITLYSRGYSIRKRLIEENLSISSQGIYNLIKKFLEKGTIVDLPYQRR